jgi:hypothetical protein
MIYLVAKAYKIGKISDMTEVLKKTVQRDVNMLGK